jgi:hypothetical protein
MLYTKMEAITYELLLIGLYLLTGLLALHTSCLMSVLQDYIMTRNFFVQLTAGVPTSFPATAPENDRHRSSGYLTAN